jgi:hypothetical protein
MRSAWELSHGHSNVSNRRAVLAALPRRAWERCKRPNFVQSQSIKLPKHFKISQIQAHIKLQLVIVRFHV